MSFYNPIRRKGILLAGGTGSRMYPMTKAVNKHLLPVYDKPMIYYSLSLLMLAGIQDIMIIGRPQEIYGPYWDLFEDGKKLGLNICYRHQEKPNGIAESFIIGEDFIAGAPSCLVLGDNIFYGADFSKVLQRANTNIHPTIFGYPVKNPNRYGVAVLDNKNNLKYIEEKPDQPKSNFAIPGIYFFDNKVCEFAKRLKPSAGRGELEITDLINLYLLGEDYNGFVDFEVLGRGHAWLDAGTPESYLQSCNFVQAVQERQNLKIGCIEEIALRMGYITLNDFNNLIIDNDPINNEYKQYLHFVSNNEARQGGY